MLSRIVILRNWSISEYTIIKAIMIKKKKLNTNNSI